MSGRRDVVILGSTGSIGVQALDIIRRNPERFRVVGLAGGGSSPEALAAQAAEFGVEQVALGAEATAELAARPCDVVLNAVAGAAGLLPTLAALEAGTRVALANKESLIIGGPLVRRRAAPGQLVPVDSEHSALAQCLVGGTAAEVRRLVLTASGGPFRGRGRDALAEVTPQQALAHPTWSMGPLVTVNSATLVNKGLEVIEAHLLFDIPLDRIEVVVHPQSVVHSMVEFVDGSTLAQASPPDMRIPIAWALAWPDRVADAAPACDWTAPAAWTFEPLDTATFPAVDLARRAAAAGGAAPAVFNAADEAAVAAFLAGRLTFLGIADTIAEVLQRHLGVDNGGGAAGGNPLDVDDVLAADAWARAEAETVIARRAGEEA
ncbi:MAG: 1-deoxy-D-xylulose-5-phosphate reductoisomerase [bacterium]